MDASSLAQVAGEGVGMMTLDPVGMVGQEVAD